MRISFTCLSLLSCWGGAEALAYEVEEGDTLSEIAAEQVGLPVFGTEGSLQKVLEKNPQLEDPNLIFPGTVLNMGAVQLDESEQDEEGRQNSTNRESSDDLAGQSESMDPAKLLIQSVAGAEVGGQEPQEEVEKLEASLPVLRDEMGSSQWYLHGGLGALWIDFEGVARLPQVPIRVGVGYEKNVWSAELFYRASLFKLDEEIEGKPQWLRFSFGRKFEKKREGGLRNTYRALVGVERYSNTNVSASENFDYIEEAYSFSAGFSSHFDLTKRWQIGGLALLGLINSQSYRGLIQGNVEYAWDINWSVGGGYWFDYYSYVTGSDRNIEKQFALESYLKYYF